MLVRVSSGKVSPRVTFEQKLERNRRMSFGWRYESPRCIVSRGLSDVFEKVQGRRAGNGGRQRKAVQIRL